MTSPEAPQPATDARRPPVPLEVVIAVMEDLMVEPGWSVDRIDESTLLLDTGGSRYRISVEPERTYKYVKIPFEDAQRIFDLAVDSPLACSGRFETDDVKVLRRFAETIGADPATATPKEFVRDYPHLFKVGKFEDTLEMEWTEVARERQGVADLNRDDIYRVVAERLGIPTQDLARPVCLAGGYGRRCGKAEGDPIHVQEHLALSP